MRGPFRAIHLAKVRAIVPGSDAIVPSSDAIVPSPDAIVPSPDAIVISPDAIVARSDAIVACPDTQLHGRRRRHAVAPSTIAVSLF